MLADIASAVTQLIAMVGQVVTAFFGADGAFSSISVILTLFLGITIFKMAWGLIMGLFNKRGGKRRK